MDKELAGGIEERAVNAPEELQELQRKMDEAFARLIRRENELMSEVIGEEVRWYITMREIVPITSVRHFTDERIEKAVCVCCASLYGKKYGKKPAYQMFWRLEMIGRRYDETYVAEIVEDLRNRRMDAGERFEMVKRYSCRGVAPILLLLDAELVRRVAKIICKAFGGPK